ncbi:MAG: SDR family NAD(P)-dependent oxidoreductase [Verrucomicrobiae bacterium]|nr:SDR family NAD(P)-dependent oxidoreductase [Verrucomicrobiae bacterium]
MSLLLAGKWVMITGASSGIGAAAAVAFGAKGARLLLGARRLDRLEQVANCARITGAAEVQFHFLDVRNPESVTEFVQWAGSIIRSAASEPRNLHVLVNNAGGAHGLDPVADGKDEDWETMLQTNVLGVLRVTRAALPLMPQHAGATIINIGSVAGHEAYEGGSAYCAAKAGVRKLTEVLRLELCGTGIRVCIIEPGFTRTEFALVRFKGDAERANKVYEGMTPLTAEDIAEALVWAAERPPHVNIDQMLIKPTDQAAMHKIYRRTT